MKKSSQGSAPALPPSDATTRPVRSRVAFTGRAFNVRVDQVREPGMEKLQTREVVSHGPSAVILAHDPARGILFVRQYRHAVGRHLWELPAGGFNPGEQPRLAARRELREETGYFARKWKLIARFFPSPGFLDEEMYLFLAEELSEGDPQVEEDEHIEVAWFSFDAIAKMLNTGTLSDGKTLAAFALFPPRTT